MMGQQSLEVHRTVLCWTLLSLTRGHAAMPLHKATMMQRETVHHQDIVTFKSPFYPVSTGAALLTLRFEKSHPKPYLHHLLAELGEASWNIKHVCELTLKA
jgi:hypothetical protein